MCLSWTIILTIFSSMSRSCTQVTKNPLSGNLSNKHLFALGRHPLVEYGIIKSGILLKRLGTTISPRHLHDLLPSFSTRSAVIIFHSLCEVSYNAATWKSTTIHRGIFHTCIGMEVSSLSFIHIYPDVNTADNVIPRTHHNLKPSSKISLINMYISHLVIF